MSCQSLLPGIRSAWYSITPSFEYYSPSEDLVVLQSGLTFYEILNTKLDFTQKSVSDAKGSYYTKELSVTYDYFAEQIDEIEENDLTIILQDTNNIFYIFGHDQRAGLNKKEDSNNDDKNEVKYTITENSYQPLQYLNTTGITFIEGSSEVVYDFNPIAIEGSVTDAQNIGAGVGVFSSKNQTVLEFRRLQAGDNTTIVQSGNTIVISSDGGITGNFVSASTFNSYTASTLSTLNNKLNTSVFNTYTGNTNPVLVNAITGGTNGLTKTGRKLKFGGSLTGDTVLNISDTLTFTGNTFNVDTVGFEIKTQDSNGNFYSLTSNEDGSTIGLIAYSAPLQNRANIYLGNGTDINEINFSLDDDNTPNHRIGLSIRRDGNTSFDTDTNATFFDERTNPKGLQYAGDYEDTLESRSLVTKQYVDSLVSPITGSTTVIAGDGLTKIDSTLNWGGAISADTNVYSSTFGTYGVNFGSADDLSTVKHLRVLIPATTAETQNYFWITTFDPIDEELVSDLYFDDNIFNVIAGGNLDPNVRRFQMQPSSIELAYGNAIQKIDSNGFAFNSPSGDTFTFTTGNKVRLQVTDHYVRIATGLTAHESGLANGSFMYNTQTNKLKGKQNNVVYDLINTGSTNTLIKVVTANTYTVSISDKDYFIQFAGTGTTQRVYLPSGTTNLEFAGAKTGNANVLFSATTAIYKSTNQENVIYTSTGATSLVYHASSNKWFAFGSLGTGSTTSTVLASNGLTKVGDYIRLGGVISGDTFIYPGVDNNHTIAIGISPTTTQRVTNVVLHARAGIALQSQDTGSGDSSAFTVANSGVVFSGTGERTFEIQDTGFSSVVLGNYTGATLSGLYGYTNDGKLRDVAVSAITSNILAGNGLTKNNNTIVLGGSLTGNTSIDMNSNTLSLTEASIAFTRDSNIFGFGNLGASIQTQPSAGTQAALALTSEGMLNVSTVSGRENRILVTSGNTVISSIKASSVGSSVNVALSGITLTTTGSTKLPTNVATSPFKLYGHTSGGLLASIALSGITGTSATRVIENRTGNTNYTFVSGDLTKIKRFTNTSNITVILPSSLGTNAHLQIVRAGTGTITLSATTLNSNGTVMRVQYSGVDAYYTGSAWEAFGALFPSSDPATYTVTNVVNDRTFDASSTTAAELGQVLGTLVNDLKTKGIIQ